ncbi:MAG: hypothetical protein L6R39_006933 [Caloplaca ligustica]|nr:MAG: hypothetical protein L6R39_006933 [Caloplaca ligustica]
MWNLFSYVASVHSLLSAPAKRVIISDEEKALQDGYIQAAAEEDLLVVSPYTRRPHLLDLTNLTKSQTYLAKALTRLSPLTHAYATVPYVKAFNWDVVFGSLAAAVKADGFSWTEQFFFIVVFRSQVPPSTDRSHLAELDKKAHMEAMASGGLFKYWFGVPDHDGRNLATCIWRRCEDAAPGSSGEGHKAAMRATINMYSEWHIERFKLVISDNAKQWNIVPWTD